MEGAPKRRLKVAPMTFRSQQHTSMQHRLRGGQPYGRARRGKEMGADGVVEERGTQGVRPDRPPRGRSGQAHLVPQSAIGATGAVHHARTAPRKEGSHLDTILRDARHGARVCTSPMSEWQSRYQGVTPGVRPETSESWALDSPASVNIETLWHTLCASRHAERHQERPCTMPLATTSSDRS